MLNTMDRTCPVTHAPSAGECPSATTPGKDRLANTAPTLLNLDELAHRCRDEIRRYQHDGTPNAHSPYGMELYRRAVAMRDERAWSLIYDLYHGLVMSWINTYAYIKGPNRCDLEEQDALVNTAFARFFCAFTTEHLAQCSSFASILYYLKLCTRSTVFDALRRQQVRLVELSLDALQETCYSNFIGEESGQDQVIVEQVIGRVWAEDLWQVIQEELRSDDERVLLFLMYVQEMRPAQIARQYPQWFPTLDAVLLMQGRIRTRLLKNPRIRGILAAHRGNDAAPELLLVSPPSDSPSLATSAPVQAEPVSLSQATRVEETAPADAAAHRCNLLGTEKSEPDFPPVVSIVASSREALFPTIHYRLQKSFCGKARCRKCREGEGHGPYWFAYRYAHGKTIRSYVGKSLPAGVMVAGTAATII